ncbi:MAG: hypothetical protein GX126_14235 [Bacteroidales bacterium]|jgi:hypothetical protein|nr:hypothetical protein [Bacteroidales bacterium]
MINFEKGTYGYDKNFLKKNIIEIVELKDKDSNASVLLAPGYQGRVMTSTAGGDKGLSFGWINYKLIESGRILEHINPVGGEERFWLGPEGGPFSIYFEQGSEQIFDNWQVPAVLDTEPFEIIRQDSESVTFTKNSCLTNASGAEFSIGIERTVKLLHADSLSAIFHLNFSSPDIKLVAYQSENKITNTGTGEWTKEKGLLSVWMLSMFNPSPATTVFLPYNTAGSGTVVNDDYFGKVPSERLIIDSGTVFFKIDGKFRSKIGLPEERATEMCGSYDSQKNILTLIWCSLPKEKKEYLNSKWGDQDNPYLGDVINAYNDGPVEDGSIMGPFYEIETSSPAAGLKPGESLTHTQRVVHIQGDEKNLAKLTYKLFKIDLQKIKSVFQ